MLRLSVIALGYLVALAGPFMISGLSFKVILWVLAGGAIALLGTGRQYNVPPRHPLRFALIVYLAGPVILFGLLLVFTRHLTDEQFKVTPLHPSGWLIIWYVIAGGGTNIRRLLQHRSQPAPPNQ